jgi:oligopeptide transport system substrate-binding protein
MAACRRADAEYFGRTDPPAAQRLVYLIGAEPSTLDPARSTDLWEGYVIHAMFEGLTTSHPRTSQPMAALATHYDVAPDGLRYTFYLRGHTRPRGERLPNTSTLADEYRSGGLAEDFARDRPAPPDDAPAHWSDGTVITAYDVVYSWRRALDPALAATYAYLMYYIQGAEEVNSGKLPPERLGVHATGDFSLEVELRAPTSFFLQLISLRVFCPTPRRVIEAARATGAEYLWTEPGRIVTSGAFTLAQAQRQDRGWSEPALLESGYRVNAVCSCPGWRARPRSTLTAPERHPWCSPDCLNSSRPCPARKIFGRMACMAPCFRCST